MGWWWWISSRSGWLLELLTELIKSKGWLKRLKIGTTCVFTAALAKASPSPALVIDPWDPALKARKPKSRIRNPRQQKGIEWPEMPPAFVHRSVLVRGWCTNCCEICPGRLEVVGAVGDEGVLFF